jgi:hypothetical protein
MDDIIERLLCKVPGELARDVKEALGDRLLGMRRKPSGRMRGAWTAFELAWEETPWSAHQVHRWFETRGHRLFVDISSASNSLSAIRPRRHVDFLDAMWKPPAWRGSVLIWDTSLQWVVIFLDEVGGSGPSCTYFLGGPSLTAEQAAARDPSGGAAALLRPPTLEDRMDKFWAAIEMGQA